MEENMNLQILIIRLAFAPDFSSTNNRLWRGKEFPF